MHRDVVLLRRWDGPDVTPNRAPRDGSCFYCSGTAAAISSFLRLCDHDPALRPPRAFDTQVNKLPRLQQQLLLVNSRVKASSPGRPARRISKHHHSEAVMGVSAESSDDVASSAEERLDYLPAASLQAS